MQVEAYQDTEREIAFVLFEYRVDTLADGKRRVPEAEFFFGARQ